jgi:hypothetical protein
MPILVWTTHVCPRCSTIVPIGIMSLCATCDCGLYFVDVVGCRGWYASRAAYERGEQTVKAVL